MKHLYYGEAAFLIGDEVADVVVEYTVMMAQKDMADSVTLRVLDSDGNEESSTFVLGPATMLTVETTRSSLQEPDNSDAIRYMTERIAALRAPLKGMPFAERLVDQFDDYF